MKSFIEFLIEKMKPTTDATAVVDILNADEAVKSTAQSIELKGKSVVIIKSNKTSAKDRSELLDYIQSIFSSSKRMSQKNSYSTIGYLDVNGVKIVVKPAGKSAGTDAEFEEVDSINKFIAENGGIVFVKDNNGASHDVVKADKVTGTPKADIALLNSKGQEVIWISHKKGKTASSFQNYGGISPKEIDNLASNSDASTAYEEVRAFAAACKVYFTDAAGQLTKFYDAFAPIHSQTLIRYSVYGKDAVDDISQCGRNNVSFLCQGKIVFTEDTDGVFLISSTGCFEANPSIPVGQYRPKLLARTANDRSSYGLPRVRMGIYPLAYHPHAIDLLGSLKQKYKYSQKLKSVRTLAEFIDIYCRSGVKDFYHSEQFLQDKKQLTVDDILSYSCTAKEEGNEDIS